ncbi:MAG: hypothetical protein EOM03_10335 [Clostridia bacterium]|nr:hypothetical protein [Clostridia bacterium]
MLVKYVIAALALLMALVLMMQPWPGLSERQRSRGLIGISRLQRPADTVGTWSVIAMLSSGVVLAIRLTLAFPELGLPAWARCFGLLAILWPAAQRDRLQRIIPNLYILVGFIIWLFLSAATMAIDAESSVRTLGESLVVAIVMLVFFLLLRLGLPGGIGWGDAKLMILMALFLDVQSFILTLAFAFFSAFAAALFWTLSKRMAKSAEFAFAPFLMGGYYAGVFLTGM